MNLTKSIVLVYTIFFCQNC